MRLFQPKFRTHFTREGNYMTAVSNNAQSSLVLKAVDDFKRTGRLVFHSGNLNDAHPKTFTVSIGASTNDLSFETVGEIYRAVIKEMGKANCQLNEAYGLLQDNHLLAMLEYGKTYHVAKDQKVVLVSLTLLNAPRSEEKKEFQTVEG